MKKNKSIIILSIIAFFLTSCKKTPIELLNTDKDVFSFLKKEFPQDSINKFEEYYNENIRIADSLKFRYWTKGDIDNNGETDLILFNTSGYPFVTVILSLNGKYKKESVNDLKDRYYYSFPKFKRINKQPLILLFYKQTGRNDSTGEYYTKIKSDTIEFKDSIFLNYVENPIFKKIDSIEISNNGFGAEGYMPSIWIKINTNTFDNFRKIENKEFKKLSEEQIKKIIQLIKYSNFHNEYYIARTDQTTTFLKIYYNDGSVKTIKDYGTVGSFTLREIYKITFNKE